MWIQLMLTTSSKGNNNIPYFVVKLYFHEMSDLLSGCDIIYVYIVLAL